MIYKMVRQPGTFIIFRNFLSGDHSKFEWKINNFEGLIDGKKMP